jgi:hypothetical protein
MGTDFPPGLVVNISMVSKVASTATRRSDFARFSGEKPCISTLEWEKEIRFLAKFMSTVLVNRFVDRFVEPSDVLTITKPEL